MYFKDKYEIQDHLLARTSYRLFHKALKACELLKEQKVINLNKIYGNAIGEVKVTETNVETTHFYNVKIAHHEGLPIITYCFEIETMEVK